MIWQCINIQHILWKLSNQKCSLYLRNTKGGRPFVNINVSELKMMKCKCYFFLSMNDVTEDYLWVAPLKLDLFPHILCPFTPPLYSMFCRTFRATIWSHGIWEKEGLPRFLHPPSFSWEWILWCRYKEGSSGGSPPILHLYCIGRGTKVTVVVTGLTVYDPLKWLRMEIGPI